MHRCCGEYRDAGTALRCGLGWATTKREKAQGAPPRAALGCEGSVVPTPHTQGGSRNDDMEQGFRALSGISKGSPSKEVGAKATCNGGGGKSLAK